MSRLPGHVDVLVVGAGVAGAATACALAAGGVEPLILERAAAPPTEASSRSAAIVRTSSDDEALRPFLEAGGSIHRDGPLATLRATGALFLGEGDDDVARRLPFARGRGRFEPGDGVVDARELMRRLLEGRRMLTDVEVHGVEPAGGALRVTTSAGGVTARVVVNAAGAWAGRIGGLPLEARKRHLFVTKAMGARPDWPIVWDDREGYYLRPEGEALLLCACDERPCVPGDNAIEPDAEAELRAKLARCQPGLPPFEVARAWAGQRTFAPDGRFVLGWDPRMAGLFHVAGLGGHGMTAGPALGVIAASLILLGPGAPEPVPASVQALAPSRLLPA